MHDGQSLSFPRSAVLFSYGRSITKAMVLALSPLHVLFMEVHKPCLNGHLGPHSEADFRFELHQGDADPVRLFWGLFYLLDPSAKNRGCDRIFSVRW